MKTVTVVTNVNKDPQLEVTQRLITELSAFAKCIKISENIKIDCCDKVVFLPEDKIFDDTDVVITVGGDGTILQIAPTLAEKNIAVLGINLGRMGFMAELEKDEISLVSKFFANEYIIEPRMMLDVSIVRDGEKIQSFTALNEVVVMNGTISKMVELELYCNDTYVSRYHADGLILSTPTGSTAYSLSAGGAVIDPSLDCILATPVCAHSFYNARPIVFSSSAELSVKDFTKRSENTYVTLDGNRNFKLLPDDKLIVRKSQHTTNLIKIKSTRFYNTVYSKLSERR